MAIPKNEVPRQRQEESTLEDVRLTDLLRDDPEVLQSLRWRVDSAEKPQEAHPVMLTATLLKSIEQTEPLLAMKKRQGWLSRMFGKKNDPAEMDRLVGATESLQKDLEGVYVDARTNGIPDPAKAQQNEEMLRSLLEENPQTATMSPGALAQLRALTLALMGDRSKTAQLNDYIKNTLAKEHPETIIDTHRVAHETFLRCRTLQKETGRDQPYGEIANRLHILCIGIEDMTEKIPQVKAAVRANRHAQ